ncbi:unnamed protein product [Prunus armeniaca]|uniref:Uncharacterized protein n=1 Tax=Prunus armeniaca TaxID=36596 RepID=A0A6J5WTP8_PRUAR|nr:unnamed protein product [Prunus armeniaca]
MPTDVCIAGQSVHHSGGYDTRYHLRGDKSAVQSRCAICRHTCEETEDAEIAASLSSQKRSTI